MIEQFNSDPKLSRYIVSFHRGQTLFREGDDSQNLYILLEGRLEVLKGEQVINSIVEPGAVFGEMSFLLGSRRTATVRAEENGRAASIPRDEIDGFLEEFPELANQMTRLLAHRLDTTSQVLFGLKEFCDMLPDAVAVTDENGKVVAFNRAATELYGRQWRQVGQRPLEGLFEDDAQVREFACAAAAGQTAQEEVLSINHPSRGRRFISLSISGLYDAQHQFKGLLVVGRDVTSTHRLHHRFNRLRNWLIVASAALVLCVAALAFYPYLSHHMVAMSQRQEQLRAQFVSDRLLLTSMLAEPVAEGRIERSHEILVRFFKMPQAKTMPYTGLIILSPAKRVVEAFSPGDDTLSQSVGASYDHIDFSQKGADGHRVLTYFRQDPKTGLSHKVLALAFRLRYKGRDRGWLLVTLDPKRLQKQFNANRAALAAMNMTSPEP